jgi:protein phosphatase
VTRLRGAAATDVGRVRTINEDRYLATDTLFAVADGLGGHQAGEVASRTAVETLRQEFDGVTVDGLIDAALAANHAVWELAQQNDDLQGMATTLTAVALVTEDGEQRLALINVGDSRAYLFQRDELMQLTEDHSLVEQLVREGRLTSAEAQVHPQRSIITRALGLDPDVDIDSWQLIPYTGDRLLLCSDGLTNEVTDDDIAATLRRVPDPEKAAKDLVDQARAHGGNDNITVVVVDIADDDGRAETASAALAAQDGSGPKRGTATTVKRRVDRGATRGDTGARAGLSEPAQPRHRWITWRVVAFLVALVAVAVVVVWVVVWNASSTYYVGLKNGQVEIFKGHVGGKVVQSRLLSEADVPAARLPDVVAGHRESSLADAQRYVNELRQQAAEQRSEQPAPGTTPP